MVRLRHFIPASRSRLSVVCLRWPELTLRTLRERIPSVLAVFVRACGSAPQIFRALRPQVNSFWGLLIARLEMPQILRGPLPLIPTPFIRLSPDTFLPPGLPHFG